jgi:hypothetical protein
MKENGGHRIGNLVFNLVKLALILPVAVAFIIVLAFVAAMALPPAVALFLLGVACDFVLSTSLSEFAESVSEGFWRNATSFADTFFPPVRCVSRLVWEIVGAMFAGRARSGAR